MRGVQKGSLGSKIRYRRRTGDDSPPRRRRTSTESGAPHEVEHLSDVKEEEVSCPRFSPLSLL